MDINLPWKWSKVDDSGQQEWLDTVIFREKVRECTGDKLWLFPDLKSVINKYGE